MRELLEVPRSLAGRAWSWSRSAAHSHERLRREHSSLRSDLRAACDAIRQLEEERERGIADRRATRRLLRQLRGLERRLRGHFAAEEASGYLSDAVQAAPRYHSRASALRAQHPDLAAELHRVRTLARGAADSPEAWEEVRRRFGQLADLIAAHEEAESEIVRGSLQDDLGTVD